MTRQINAPHFDLAATLECGQAFRWSRRPDGWFTGIVGRERWQLRQTGDLVEVAGPAATTAVDRYLSLDRSLPAIVATFPADAPLRDAVARHWGLRVLRQEPWETLVSFIASATKQIVQIRQIIEMLARRFGEPVGGDAYSFPAPAVLARATLPDLLACKLGFRALRVQAAAQAVDAGKLDLAALARTELPRAREELLKLPGVGDKIANCVLLFSGGHDDAFPIDVWVARSLQRLYFPRRRVSVRALREFTATHFGPHAGWAQQYLFHAERQRR